MDPEQPVKNQEKPAEEKAVEKPVSSGPGDNRRRPDPRRPRFRRDGRGGRGGGRSERDERPRPPEEARRRPAGGSIGEAIQQVEHIRSELEEVLGEIQEVLQTLDQVEREKSASEDEIEKLRDSLRSLHRDTGYARNPRSQASRPPPPSESAPMEEEAPQEID